MEMNKGAKKYTVRRMDVTGDSKCEMTLQEVQKSAESGQFLFVDTEMADGGKVTAKELDGATEILLTSKLVGG